MNKNANAVGNDGKEKEQFCFNVLTGKQIQDAEVPKADFLVDGLITPGLNLLAAPRKRGKSWMALDLALCVAGDGDFLGHKTKHGKALYFALEDNVDRMKRRIDAVMDDADAPEGLMISFSAGAAGSSFFKSIDGFLEAHSDVRIVIIDVLQKIRMDKQSNQTEYSHDYNECGQLKEIADKHGVSILLVHHTRKTKDSDPLNEIAGGVGITGAADTIIKIGSSGDPSQRQSSLYVIGRDMPERKLEVAFDSDKHKWEYIGTEEELNVKRDEDEYAASPVIRAIKALIESNGAWSGTVSDLVRQSKGTANDLSGMAVSALSRKINKFDEFMERDGIIHTRPNPNGGVAGRKHIFVRQDKVAEPPETGGVDASPVDMPAMEEPLELSGMEGPLELSGTARPERWEDMLTPPGADEDQLLEMLETQEPLELSEMEKLEQFARQHEAPEPPETGGADASPVNMPAMEEPLELSEMEELEYWQNIFTLSADD